MKDALNDYFVGPDKRSDFMFMNGDMGTSVSCRIRVPVPCDADFELVRRISGVYRTGTTDEFVCDRPWVI